MKLRDQTVEDAVAAIKKAIVEADDEIIADLRSKSETSVILDRPFSLFVKQAFWQPGTPFAKPADGSMPEFALVISRVGFDQSRAKALVYIGAIRWDDKSKSFGDYLLLVKEESAWTVRSTLRAWELKNEK